MQLHITLYAVMLHKVHFSFGRLCWNVTKYNAHMYS